MRDLRSAKSMWLKAVMFLVIGITSVGLLWLDTPTVKTALLLAATIWAFSRAYYFAFYVLEKYIDPQFRYSGLGSMLIYLLRSRTKNKSPK